MPIRNIRSKALSCCILLTILVMLPGAGLATINTIYDAKLKYQQLQDKLSSAKDAVANSPIYGIIFYAGEAIGVLILAIVVVFLLIMLLRR